MILWARLLELARLALERLERERQHRRAARARRAGPRIPLTVERRQIFVAEDRRL